ncbi:hypothetical protein C5167_017381 [Papaver somniferum]|uniref:Uncharacterized protein n=1 Tax=Papaver somniferum TaxID=3469 RepID=A0A4Y7INC8_PAPSO|nr:hypothetical protein C5167_017381 [Papaver somniferum]
MKLIVDKIVVVRNKIVRSSDRRVLNIFRCFWKKKTPVSGEVDTLKVVTDEENGVIMGASGLITGLLSSAFMATSEA